MQLRYSSYKGDIKELLRQNLLSPTTSKKSDTRKRTSFLPVRSHMKSMSGDISTDKSAIMKLGDNMAKLEKAKKSAKPFKTGQLIKTKYNELVRE